MIHSAAPNFLDDNPTFAIHNFSELLIFMTTHKTIYFLYNPWVNIYLVCADNRIQSKLQVFNIRTQVEYASVNINNYTWVKTKHQNSCLCMLWINKHK